MIKGMYVNGKKVFTIVDMRTEVGSPHTRDSKTIHRKSRELKKEKPDQERIFFFSGESFSHLCRTKMTSHPSWGNI